MRAFTIERAGYAAQNEFPYTDRMRRAVYRSELVTKIRAFGELEIGRIDGQGIAVWRDNKLLGTSGGEAHEWIERDGELFGVSWSQWESDETWREQARFEALAIGADGSFREGLVQLADPFLDWASIDEVKPSKDLRTLVIRGVLASEPQRTTVATWTYDARTRDWRPKVTHTARAPTPR